MKPVLRHIVAGAVGDVHLLGEFVQEVGASVLAKIPTKRPGDFTEAEREELQKFGEFLSLSEKVKPSARSRRRETVAEMRASHRVGSYVMQVAIPIKQQTFLAEMSLVYLVARLEAFMKDYLKEVLLLKPAMLKSSATLTSEDVLSHGSMRTLKEALAEREADQLGYGSIDDVAAFFLKRMNVNLASFPEWDRLREQVYRRNLIVHNGGKVNATYRKKVKTHTEGEDLSTNPDYVRDASSTVKAFIKYLHSCVSAKLGINEI